MKAEFVVTRKPHPDTGLWVYDILLLPSGPQQVCRGLHFPQAISAFADFAGISEREACQRLTADTEQWTVMRLRSHKPVTRLGGVLE